jgi:uncharacterized repeat protein (TIGR04076 family)
MAKDPAIGFQVTASVTGIKGNCTAGHRVGESFGISCHDAGGLCGWCYHAIFPMLQTFQFGGNLPWWNGADEIDLACPDPHNQLTLKLQRKTRVC